LKTNIQINIFEYSENLNPAHVSTKAGELWQNFNDPTVLNHSESGNQANLKKRDFK